MALMMICTMRSGSLRKLHESHILQISNDSISIKDCMARYSCNTTIELQDDVDDLLSDFFQGICALANDTYQFIKGHRCLDC
jgi:hypothetical protein